MDTNMEIKIENQIPNDENDRDVPISQENSRPEKDTYAQKTMIQTFNTAANLANLLPTGSVLAFQILSPIFTNQAMCSSVNKIMTIVLISLCGLSCFLFSFTDSFKDKNGRICYIFPTCKGLWVIDGSTSVPMDEASKYKLKFIDFFHAFLSVMVFGAVVLLDKNAVTCFYPNPSDELEKALQSLPIAIGVICSMLFATFPTKRHGIGYPITAPL